MNTQHSITCQTEVLCEFPNAGKLQRIQGIPGNPSIEDPRYPKYSQDNIAVTLFTNQNGYHSGYHNKAGYVAYCHFLLVSSLHCSQTYSTLPYQGLWKFLIADLTYQGPWK